MAQWCLQMAWWIVRLVYYYHLGSLIVSSSSQCSTVCMYCPVCVMVHIKYPLLLIKKEYQYDAMAEDFLSLSEGFLSIFPVAYNHK